MSRKRFSIRVLLALAALAILGLAAGCKTYQYPARINMGSDLAGISGPGPVAAMSAIWCGWKGMQAAPARGAATPVTRLVDTIHGEPLKEFVLTAQVVTREGLPDEWTFNGSVPGPPSKDL